MSNKVRSEGNEPSPTCKTMLAIQLRNANSKQRPKSISKLTSTVQDRRPEGNLPAIVEHTEVVERAREKRGFDETEHETCINGQILLLAVW